MRAQTDRLGSLLWVMLAVSVLALGQARGQQETVIVDFRIPEYDAQGRMKSQIMGDRARVLTNGSIVVTNVRLELYRDGTLDVTVTSPTCVYDRNANTVASDDKVRLESRQAVITGVGLRWNRNEERAVILDQARVEIRDTQGWFVKEMKHVP